MNIQGVRGLGDKELPPVIDALISSLPVALSRATSELDSGEGFTPVVLKTVHRVGVYRGQMVKVFDNLNGEEYIAKVSKVQHTRRGTDVVSTIEVLRR